MIPFRKLPPRRRHAETARYQRALRVESLERRQLLAIDLTTASAAVNALSFEPGETLALDLSVRNIGSTTSNSAFVDYYLRQGSLTFSSTYRVGSDLIPRLASNGTSNETFSYSLPTTPGTYYFSYWIDARGSNSESNENNNRGWWPITIEAPSPPQPPGTPDLRPSDDTGHSSTDNITSVTTNLSFDWTFSPGADGYFYEWNDPTPDANFVTSNGVNIDAPSGTGWRTFYVSASNSAGQSQSRGVSVYIDRIGPSIGTPDLSPADDTGYSSFDHVTSDQNVRMEWSGNGNGLEVYRYYFGWSPGNLAASTTNTHVNVSPPQSNGLQQFYVQAEGQSGLRSPIRSVSVEFDTLPPVSPTPTSPVGQINSLASTIQWPYNNSDDWKYEVDLEYFTTSSTWQNVAGWPKVAERTSAISTGVLSANTNYRVRVQEYDIAGNPGNYSDWVNFWTPDGPSVTTAAPPVEDIANRIVDHIVARFDQQIDESTFTAADVTLTRDGVPIPVTSVTSPFGDASFHINFPLQTQAGTYSYTIGPDIRNPAGLAMNQDGDQQLGEVPADSFTGSFVITPPPFISGPKVVGAAFGPPPSDIANGWVDHVVVPFDKSIDPTTFTPTDIDLMFDGQPIPIDGIDVVSATAFRANFAPQTAVGTYSVDVGPGILDTDGHAMNQDGDMENGEPLDDVFPGSFALSTSFDTGPWVVSHTPNNTVEGSVSVIEVTFSELIDETTFTPMAVHLSRDGLDMPVTTVARRGSQSHEVHFPIQSTPGTYVLRIDPAITDRVGNAMNHNLNGVNAEPGDYYEGTFEIFDSGPFLVTTSPIGTTHAPFDHIEVYFNEPIAPSSLTGNISIEKGGQPIAIDTFVPISDRAYEIQLAPQSELGDYVVSISVGVTDTNGNPLNQHRDLQNGQPNDSFTSSLALVPDDTSTTNVVRLGASANLPRETYGLRDDSKSADWANYGLSQFTDSDAINILKARFSKYMVQGGYWFAAKVIDDAQQSAIDAVVSQFLNPASTNVFTHDRDSVISQLAASTAVFEEYRDVLIAHLKTQLTKIVSNTAPIERTSQIINSVVLDERLFSRARINELSIAWPEWPAKSFNPVALRKLFGGTQGIEVELEGFGVESGGNAYHGTLVFHISDMFGVSLDDWTLTPSSRANNIAAQGNLETQWILQHRTTEAVPLVHVIDIAVPFSGTFPEADTAAVAANSVVTAAGSALMVNSLTEPSVIELRVPTIDPGGQAPRVFDPLGNQIGAQFTSGYAQLENNSETVRWLAEPGTGYLVDSGNPGFQVDLLASSLAAGRSSLDNSPVMVGDVRATVVLLQNSEGISQWTGPAIEQARDAIEQGLQFWVDARNSFSGQSDLYFDLDYTFADTPISVPAPNGDDFSSIVDAFRDTVGFAVDASDSDATRLRDGHQFNYDQRISHGAESAITIFVTREALDNRPVGWAEQGGPWAVITAENGLSPELVAHEIGHLFHALDEYAGGHSYDARSGYLNVQNTNATDGNPDISNQVPSIMLDPYAAFPLGSISPAAAAMVGWRDSDGDGVGDLFDVPPVLIGGGVFDEDARELELALIAQVQALENQNNNPFSIRTFTLNTLDRLEYRIDGGEWMTATSEIVGDQPFEVVFNTIPVGVELMEVRVIDSVGNVSENLVIPLVGAEITELVVNDGDQQRTAVRELRFELDQVGFADVSALTIVDAEDGSPVDLTGANFSGSGTTTLAWDISGVDLPNGRYIATLNNDGVRSTSDLRLRPHAPQSFHKLEADANGDGRVSNADVFVVINNLTVPGDEPFRPGDLDGDGRVSNSDLFVWINNNGNVVPEAELALAGPQIARSRDAAQRLTSQVNFVTVHVRSFQDEQAAREAAHDAVFDDLTSAKEITSGKVAPVDNRQRTPASTPSRNGLFALRRARLYTSGFQGWGREQSSDDDVSDLAEDRLFSGVRRLRAHNDAFKRLDEDWKS